MPHEGGFLWSHFRAEHQDNHPFQNVCSIQIFLDQNMDDIYDSVGSIFDFYLENPSRQPHAMGSGDRITSYGCDGSVSSHLVRLKRFGPWPTHGILCALLNNPNFCWKAKQYQSKHPNSWDKKSKQTQKATCSASSIQARGVLIRKMCEAGYYKSLQ